MIQTARQRATYIIADFISANVSWFAFNIVRYFTLPYNYGQMSLNSYLSMHIVLIGQLAFPVMMVMLFAISGYYNKVFFKSRLDDVLNAAGISIIGAAIIFFTALFNDTIDDRLGNAEMILILWLLFTAIISVPRLAINSLTTKRIWHREIAFKTIVIGKSDRAKRLAEDLENRYRNMGFKVLNMIDENEVDQHLRDDIDSYIIVPDNDNERDTLNLINRLLPTGKSIYMTPDTYMFITSRPRTSMIAGHVLIDVSCTDMRQSTLNLKRLGDIVFSSIAMISLLPIYAAIAIAIKMDSKGPIIYKQERLGYKKRPFNIYKFRSMHTDAEANGPALSSTDDKRITRVGQTLRKYRLDELPQFWNVLRGDMSLVGPRPERKYFFDQIIQRAPYFTLVHQVRPGITSWGMVKYGYASSVDAMIQRMQYDLLYIENVSFAVDMKILFYTVNTVITGRGV